MIRTSTWWAFICVLLPDPCFAHALNPGVLEFTLHESSATFTWNPPSPATSDPVPGQERISRSGPIFNENCEIQIIGETDEGGLTGNVSCNSVKQIEGQIKGLEGLPCEIIVLWTHPSGPQSEVLRHEPRLFNIQLDERQSSTSAWSSYLSLGAIHISEGFDHLLFVMGLLLLLHRIRDCVLALTSFTIGHGISMALYVTGNIVAKPALVETLISLSLVALALEVLKNRERSRGLFQKYPWVVALTFGLIHGLGFAGALMEIGLPEQTIWPSLLAFNMGVELGQLVFAFFLFGFLYFIRKQFNPRPLEIMASYGIGIIGIFWTIERGVHL